MVIGQGVVVEPSTLNEVFSWATQPLVFLPAITLILLSAVGLFLSDRHAKLFVPCVSIAAVLLPATLVAMLGLVFTSISYGGYAADQVEDGYGVSLYNIEGTQELRHSRSSLSPNKEFLRVTVYQDSTFIGDAYIDTEDASTADQDATRYTLFAKDDALEDEYVEFSELSAGTD